MEFLELIVPMVMVPFTVAMIYGGSWAASCARPRRKATEEELSRIASEMDLCLVLPSERI